MPSYDSEKDFDIYKHAARCIHVRAVDLAELTGRGKRAIQRRMQKLAARGYFDWRPSPYNSDEWVYFPTQLGWDYALEIGATKYEVNANREKREGQLKHDLMLTELYKALYRVFGDKLYWVQLSSVIHREWGHRRTKRGDRVDEYIKADAFFYFHLPDGTYCAYFVEIENQKGVEEPLRKMRAYLGYLESGEYEKDFGSPDFFVLILKENPERAGNVLKAAGEDHELAVRKFCISDYANPLTYRTPADYETRTHSLVKG